MVDVKGNMVDVKDNMVDVKDNMVDVKDNMVDVKGNRVDVKGDSVNVIKSNRTRLSPDAGREVRRKRQNPQARRGRETVIRDSATRRRERVCFADERSARCTSCEIAQIAEI
eukprot:1189818-Prorocentrum_minimum.AAC.2